MRNRPHWCKSVHGSLSLRKIISRIVGAESRPVTLTTENCSLSRVAWMMTRSADSLEGVVEPRLCMLDDGYARFAYETAIWACCRCGELIQASSLPLYEWRMGRWLSRPVCSSLPDGPARGGICMVFACGGCTTARSLHGCMPYGCMSPRR